MHANFDFRFSAAHDGFGMDAGPSTAADDMGAGPSTAADDGAATSTTADDDDLNTDAGDAGDADDEDDDDGTSKVGGSMRRSARVDSLFAPYRGGNSLGWTTMATAPRR
jgi:hypothetical protein